MQPSPGCICFCVHNQRKCHAYAQVHKVGNSLNLRLPKDAANALRVSEGDIVYLTETADGDYRVTAFDPEFERQMALAGKGMRQYRNALRELRDNSEMAV